MQLLTQPCLLVLVLIEIFSQLIWISAGTHTHIYTSIHTHTYENLHRSSLPVSGASNLTSLFGANALLLRLQTILSLGHILCILQIIFYLQFAEGPKRFLTAALIRDEHWANIEDASVLGSTKQLPAPWVS